MLTKQIEVTRARSLEHAAEAALERAAAACVENKDDYRETHRVKRVVFRTLEITPEYRGEPSITYTFEAELEEL